MTQTTTRTTHRDRRHTTQKQQYNTTQHNRHNGHVVSCVPCTYLSLFVLGVSTAMLQNLAGTYAACNDAGMIAAAATTTFPAVDASWAQVSNDRRALTYICITLLFCSSRGARALGRPSVSLLHVTSAAAFVRFSRLALPRPTPILARHSCISC